MILLPAMAQAASFECKKAHSTLEVLICADPDLSALDSEVSSAYFRLRNILAPGSDDSQQGLSAQREFLKSRLETCPIPATPEISESETRAIISCLKTLYTGRLDALEKQLTGLASTKSATSAIQAPLEPHPTSTETPTPHPQTNSDMPGLILILLLTAFCARCVYVLYSDRQNPPADHIYRNARKVPKLSIDIAKKTVYVHKSQYDLKDRFPHAFGGKERVKRVVPIKFEELVSCEAVTSKQVETLDKSDSPVGRALVGGALFGPSGAWIGALTAQQRTESRTTGYTLDLKITTTNLADHLHVIHFCDQDRPLSQRTVKKAAIALEYWHSLINAVIHQPHQAAFAEA
jgi:uncharacterized protein YecT (DUF1311 family)